MANSQHWLLNVCSSTKIYGKSFDSVYAKKYTNLFNECKNLKNVNYQFTGGKRGWVGDSPLVHLDTKKAKTKKTEN